MLGLTIGGYAIVQNFHGTRMHGRDAGSMVGHISKVFGEFAAFDLNKDGQLEGGEKDSLAKAIENGSLILPAHTQSKDAFSSEEGRLNHMVEMFARFAVYDANHDGSLDSNEQAAVRKAMENGELGFNTENIPAGNRLHQLVKSLHSR